MIYLGKITIPAGQVKSNRDTAVPFSCPPWSQRATLRLLASDAGAGVEVGPGEDFETEAGHGFPVAVDGTDRPDGIPVPQFSNPTISIVNESIGSIDVDVWVQFGAWVELWDGLADS